MTKQTNLPDGWQEVELGNKEYFDIISSGINEFEGEKDYLSTESIQETKIEKVECKITYENRPSRANMQPVINSIWFAKMKATLKVYCFDDNNKNETKKYILSTGFCGIKVNEKLVCPQYLRFFLISKDFNEEKDRLSTGSTQMGINNEFIAKVRLLIPLLATQKRIVQILEKAEQAKRKREEADKLTNNYLKSVFYEMFGDLNKNNKKFEIKFLEELCPKDKTAIKAGPFGSSLKKSSYSKSGYKIYGQEQVISGDLNLGDYYISEEKYKELESYKIRAGDILISLVGTYGKILIVPDKFHSGIINPRLMKITLDQAKMIPIFFKSLFLSDHILNQLKNVSHGGTMDIINVGIIKKIKFPNPPLPLQQKFSKIVEHVEKLKEKQQKSKEKINEMFNVLMQRAFKGELIK